VDAPLPPPFVGALAALIPSAALADVRLPAVISDGMVVQQNSKLVVWGWADPQGEAVSVAVTWGAPEVRASVRADGTWRVEIPTPSALDAMKFNNGRHAVNVIGNNTLTVSDVLVGEVWLCSGQSNMEWPLWNAEHGDEAVRTADFPDIRLFNVPNVAAPTPRPDCEGAWTACTPASVRDFSAVGFFFGRELHNALHVPIGLISSEWGGTPAEAWTSADTIKEFPEFASHLEACRVIREREKNAANGDPQMDAWIAAIDKADVGSHDAATDPSGGWYAPGFSDSSWRTAQVPGEWQGDLSTFDGVAWMRREFNAALPADASTDKATLFLGPVDDSDAVWINGVRIAQSMGGDVFNKPRRYTIPAGILKRGSNTIAVRVLDTGGAGGIMGAPELSRIEFAREGGPAFVQTLAGEWRVKAGTPVKQLPARPNILGPNPNTATMLYNGMIAPIRPYTIRGAIWYQGESNRDRAYQYRSLFPAMIKDWRRHWGENAESGFPFYFVQIAPFGYGGDSGQAAELREAQTRTLSLGNTGMAVTMDIGDPGDIHPRNKIEVGRRLSLWALSQTYGKTGVEYSGPLFKSASTE